MFRPGRGPGLGPAAARRTVLGTTRLVYWVGNSGTWDGASTTHWAETSGGPAGATAPASGDTVIIDANSGTGTITIAAGAVCGNLTVTWTTNKTNTLALSAAFAPTGVVNINGIATSKIFIASSTVGTPQTLTIATLGSLSNVDFMDITGAGAAAPFTGTLLGDAGGNSNITFTASATQFWKTTVTGTQNWDTLANWFLATNGAGGAGRMPLPQDDVTFDANSIGAAATSINTNGVSRLGRNINFTGVTNTPSFFLNGGSGPGVFGSFAFAAGMTFGAWNTVINFRGRGSFTITSAGLTWPSNFAINGFSGTYTLADNFTSADTGGNNLTLTSGTFDAGGFNVKCTGSASGRLAQIAGGTLNMGSGTWEWATGTGGAFWNYLSGTVNAGTSTIKVSGTVNAALSFNGGGKTYANLWYNGTGLAPLTLSGANTFADVKVDKGLILENTAGTTQTMATFTTSGAAPGGGDVAYGQTFAVSGGYFSSPDSVASSITGDIDLRAQIAMPNWVPGANASIVAKDAVGAGDRAYDFFIGSTGLLSFAAKNGVTSYAAGASVATGLVNGATSWVRMTRASATGFCNFYLSSDGSIWNLLGTADRASGAGALADTAEEVSLSASGSGGTNNGGGNFGVMLRIFRAQILNGIAGSVVVDFDPSRFTGGTTFTAATSEVWTLKGNAIISATNRVGITSTTASVVTMAKTGGGKVKSDYMAIRLSTVTPNPFTWYAGNNSWDEGTNTGWSFYSPDYVLTCAAGSYTLTGVAANELYGRRLAAAAGAYALTGVAANELCTRLLVASAGSYALTGKAANELYGRRLVAAAGAYTLAGVADRLLRGYALPASAGAYALTGVADRLLRAYIMPGSPGAYAYTGVSATFISTRPVTAFASDGVWIVSRRGTHWRAIARPTTWYVARRPQRLNG